MLVESPVYNTPTHQSQAQACTWIMIHTLPTELVGHILHYLLLLREEAKTSTGKAPVGYSRLETWTEIKNYPDLLALAHTCKRLKELVYPVVFKSWVCYPMERSDKYLEYIWRYGTRELTYEEDYRAKDACYSGPGSYFLPRRSIYDFNTRSLCAEWYSSLMNFSWKPAFYIVASYKEMISDALQYVQHLNLSFNPRGVPHSKRLAKCLPKMRSLKEVTLNVLNPLYYMDTNVRYAVPITNSFASVIHQIKTHYNSLKVHTYLNLEHFSENELHRFLAKFHKSWRQWQNLVIETVMIEMVDFEFSLPRKFCKMLARLVHLKRISIYSVSRSEHGSPESKTFGPAQAAVLITNLSKLQELSVCCYRCPSDCGETAKPLVEKKRSVPPNLYKLSWPVSNIDSFKSYDNFDCITFFEAFGCRCDCPAQVSWLPVFRNLKTLALIQCKWTHIETILDHFVTTSPQMENLIIRDSDGNVPCESKLPSYFSRIKRMEFYHCDMKTDFAHDSNFSFQIVVANARQMRHLIYHHAEDGLNGLPWHWLESHILEQGTSLETIQFRPKLHFQNLPEWNSIKPRPLDTWCKLQNIKDYVEEPYSFRGILEHVVTGVLNETFILDVQLLLKRRHKLRPQGDSQTGITRIA